MKVLFVDDEQHTLRSVQRLMIHRPYESSFADSGRNALNFLKSNPVDAVVSDMVMPEMNGYELLRRIRNLYPSVARIILSGYSEAQIIQRAVMQGVATAYLLKPLEIESLTSILERCKAIRNDLSDESVHNAILSAGPLPVLSGHRKDLLEIIETDCSFDDVANVVGKDPAITTNILRLSNSAFYGRSNSVGSVREAVVCIGMSAIKSVVWSLSIIDEKTLGAEATARIHAIQVNSALVNRLTNALCHELTGHAIPDVARSMGLVHDIGMLLMEIRMPEKITTLSGVPKVRDDNGLSLREKEREICGATHSEVGGYLLDLWSFPSICVASALYHHDPVQSYLSRDEQILMSVLHVADCYAWQRSGRCEFMDACQVDQSVFDLLGRSKEEVFLVMDNLDLTTRVLREP